VIDVGAAGKGYLVDMISAIVQQAGVARFVIDAGGDLRHRGEHGIGVGLEHPLGPRLVIGVANLMRGHLLRTIIAISVAAYSATGQYGSLPSSIGVSVTLVDDVITAVTVTPRATDPTSLDYQTRFAQAVPALVVGRNIDEVNLSKVAGSSGTPDGFNAAIQRIKAEATT
jgi:hypothetical protein